MSWDASWQRFVGPVSRHQASAAGGALLLCALAAAAGCARGPSARGGAPGAAPVAVPKVPVESALTAAPADPPHTDGGSNGDGRLASAQPLVALSTDAVGRKLKEAVGQVLLVHIWATWCAPCLMELPAFDRVAQRSEARGARVLALSVDTDERDMARVPEVLRARAPHLSPTVADFAGRRDFFALFSKTWRGTIPATFVFAKDGTVHREFPSYADPQKLNAALDELLPAAAPSRLLDRPGADP